ncbi:MAG: L-Ala-D/L-Glu epimerase, partial [Campylobacterota bacterium]|nr:L-Ala-D/L-Glu epimerase [Campylobacterota bacterium]
MKITKITTEIKYIELKTPFKTALRTATHVEFVRVHVADENGNVGIGEAPATKAITDEDIEIILNSIESVREQFLNLTCKEALLLLHKGHTIGSSAKAALDMAFVSLDAKQKNRSLAEQFCIDDFTPIKTDITISLNEADVMLSDAKKAYSEGMEILKVKVGKDILHAIEVVKK